LPDSPTAYVFGYASLVALEDAGALPGRLRGFRRCWGVAMNNWEGGEGAKHWLDRASGERPRIRVAYLDLRKEAESSVNGLALPVDESRLAELDAREINYRRIDVSGAFESLGPRAEAAEPPRVFTYIGLDAARQRCQLGIDEGNVFVSSDYVATVRRAFERRGPEALAEFDRASDPLPFPERDLRVVLSRMMDG
jgi:hypothetical protein